MMLDAIISIIATLFIFYLLRVVHPIAVLALYTVLAVIATCLQASQPVPILKITKATPFPLQPSKCS